MNLFKPSAQSKSRRLARAFSRDVRGASAIEFALIAPVLIAAFLGMTELTQGMMASRRTSHLAATIGDLAAQSDSLTTANINDLFSIGASILQPFTVDTNLKIRLTSVSKRSDGQAKVDWSVGKNQTAYTVDKIMSGTAMTQLASGKSLIMTEVSYDYISPIHDLLPTMTVFTDTYYHNPRNGDKVTKT
jgi:Flp pilus assembly protein TadG